MTLNEKKCTEIVVHVVYIFVLYLDIDNGIGIGMMQTINNNTFLSKINLFSISIYRYVFT